MNQFTNEWTDGIVSKIILDEVEIAGNEMRWLIFDGPGHTDWIENLNTVLDENQMLCLTNGRRINIPRTFCFLFEMSDMMFINPSTISRCGVLYV